QVQQRRLAQAFGRRDEPRQLWHVTQRKPLANVDEPDLWRHELGKAQLSLAASAERHDPPARLGAYRSQELEPESEGRDGSGRHLLDQDGVALAQPELDRCGLWLGQI